jgi:hypothetical protein
MQIINMQIQVYEVTYKKNTLYQVQKLQNNIDFTISVRSRMHLSNPEKRSFISKIFLNYPTLQNKK